MIISIKKILNNFFKIVIAFALVNLFINSFNETIEFFENLFVHLK
jgi:hypothetical protein